MKVETYLPLGKTDPGIRAPDKAIDLSTLLQDAKQVEDLGYDALVVEETKDDPYQVMAIAAAGTTTLKLATSVAMAFPRAPAITAMSAWSIQRLSKGLLAARYAAISCAASASTITRQAPGCGTISARCRPSGTHGRRARSCIMKASDITSR